MKFTSIEKRLVFVMGVLLIILTKACLRLANEIESKGLKGVTTEIWEGKNS